MTLATKSSFSALLCLDAHSFAHVEAIKILDRMVQHLLTFGAKRILLLDESLSCRKHLAKDILNNNPNITYAHLDNQDSFLDQTRQWIHQHNLHSTQIVVTRNRMICSSNYCSTIKNGRFALHLGLSESNHESFFVVDQDGRVTDQLKSTPPEWADAYVSTGGMSFFGKALFSAPNHLNRFDHHFIDWTISSGLADAQIIGGFCLDLSAAQINDHLLEFDQWISQCFRPCLFLDRDGILIVDTGYPHRISDVEIISGASDLVNWANQKKWHVAVVSNQAGIAKRKFSQDDYINFTNFLKQKFQDLDANIKHWFACPFHIDGSDPEYTKHSISRKPNPGLLLKAMAAMPILVEQSIMVGDKSSDQIRHLPLSTYFVQGEYTLPLLSDVSIYPDLQNLRRQLVEQHG